MALTAVNTAERWPVSPGRRLIFFVNDGGRGKVRTCDPCDVNAVLYR